MKDKSIIDEIRDSRHLFAKKHGYDLHKLAVAATALVDKTQFRFATLER